MREYKDFAMRGAREKKSQWQHIVVVATVGSLMFENCWHASVLEVKTEPHIKEVR